MEPEVRKAATQVTGGQQPAGWFNHVFDSMSIKLDKTDLYLGLKILIFNNHKMENQTKQKNKLDLNTS